MQRHFFGLAILVGTFLVTSVMAPSVGAATLESDDATVSVEVTQSGVEMNQGICNDTLRDNDSCVYCMSSWPGPTGFYVLPCDEIEWGPLVEEILT